jgi:hypothetical protein
MVWEVIFPFPLNCEFAGSGMVLQGEQAMWVWEWGPFLPSFRQKDGKKWCSGANDNWRTVSGFANNDDSPPKCTVD